MFSTTTTLILFICLQTPTSGIICADFIFGLCHWASFVSAPLFYLLTERCTHDMYGCDGACKNFFNGSYACECDEKHVLAENGKTCEGQLPLIKI